MSQSYQSVEGYLFEPCDMEKLRMIETRLYSPEALTPDQRRDLANALNYVLSKAMEYQGNETV